VAKEKSGGVLVDLTTAYHTVWHQDPTCNLLQLLPDWHRVHLIMELVGNRNFTLTASSNRVGYNASRMVSHSLKMDIWPPWKLGLRNIKIKNKT